jgi:hypothetical protein
MNHAYSDVDISHGTPYDSHNGVDCAPAGCWSVPCIAHARSWQTRGHFGAAMSATVLPRIGLHQ